MLCPCLWRYSHTYPCPLTPFLFYQFFFVCFEHNSFPRKEKSAAFRHRKEEKLSFALGVSRGQGDFELDGYRAGLSLCWLLPFQSQEGAREQDTNCNTRRNCVTNKAQEAEACRFKGGREDILKTGGSGWVRETRTEAFPK